MKPEGLTSEAKLPEVKSEAVKCEAKSNVTTEELVRSKHVARQNFVLISGLEGSIASGDKLSDLHVNYAQHLQFPGLRGLQSTLYQSKKRPSSVDRVVDHLQVVIVVVTTGSLYQILGVSIPL